MIWHSNPIFVIAVPIAAVTQAIPIVYFKLSEFIVFVYALGLQSMYTNPTQKVQGFINSKSNRTYPDIYNKFRSSRKCDYGHHKSPTTKHTDDEEKLIAVRRRNSSIAPTGHGDGVNPLVPLNFPQVESNLLEKRPAFYDQWWGEYCILPSEASTLTKLCRLCNDHTRTLTKLSPSWVALILHI